MRDKGIVKSVSQYGREAGWFIFTTEEAWLSPRDIVAGRREGLRIRSVFF